MMVEIISSGKTLLQLPFLAVVIVGIALIILVMLSIYGIYHFFNKPGSSTEDAKGCTYPQCNELTKKDLRHVVIFFSTILIFIAVFLFTGDQSAMDYFSFASTITSIVLSVVAIIMTISSESKSEGVKHQIDKSVQELKDAAKTMQEYASGVDEQKKVFQEILENSKEILTVTHSMDTNIKNIDSQSKTLSSEKFGDEEDMRS